MLLINQTIVLEYHVRIALTIRHNIVDTHYCRRINKCRVCCSSSADTWRPLIGNSHEF